MACCFLAGCATQTPLPMLGTDVTGTIPMAAPAVTGPAMIALSDEEWPAAREALAQVLDPQSNGQSVNWEAGAGKLRGTFTPVGVSYAEGLQICRAFLAEITGADEVKKLQGRACREIGGDWRISDVKAWNS